MSQTPRRLLDGGRDDLALSLVVIARDEASAWPRFMAGVERLKESLPDLECILVLDPRSVDDCALMAAKDSFRVLTVAHHDLGLLKEAGRRAANGRWVLNLDVDEIPDVDCCVAIKLALQRDKQVAYALPIRTWVGKKPLRVGPFAPEFRVRLFPRTQGQWEPRTVHEGVVTSLPTATLRGRVEHYSFADLHDLKDRYQRYATYSDRARPAHDAAFRALWRGVRYLGPYGGLLRGRFGLEVAWTQMCYTWNKYKSPQG